MIKKEFLLVLRDKHALVALFIMPAIFILIMSISLKDQFTQNSISFEINIENLDKSRMSKKFIRKIKKDKNFVILKTKNSADIKILIPKNYFKDSKKEKVNTQLIIEIDGIVKGTEIEVFKAKLSRIIIEMRLASISKSLKSRVKNTLNEELFDIKYVKANKMPNSTQQSVPSWIVFGMFFVIIPMSTIYINEKKQNTLIRLTSMNISLISMTISKSIPYMIINQIQVWIMIGVGVFIVPFFNAPALEINGSIMAIVVLSTSISLAAIGLSNLIAVSAQTGEQATTIGGILNILLGAIGGVMIPKFIMPESMQTLANFSPMSWGLDGFLKIFLNSADTFMIARESLVLVAFGTFTLMISMLILQIRIRRGL
ncbi:ABC transporter permease [Sulfurimonas sp.]|uniref:ABC transporter permease n=1 Tax=Sulfurimonas sp. TaxID=2022749 RepID=UPI002AB2FF02|nr:ABC transporter permease [Sulfurimonas sp.]